MDVDAAHRLRGALLATVGVAALALGGWWWRAEAPTSGPVGASADAGIAPDRASAAGYRPEELASDVRVRVQPGATSSFLVDARTGAVIGSGGESEETVSGSARPGGWRSGGELVWTERARLSSGGAVVRQTRIEHGERHLLRFSCTGPGELLVAVAGARSAAPMTVGCDGGLAIMELTGTGAPARLSFSPAGSEPIQIEARLIALR